MEQESISAAELDNLVKLDQKKSFLKLQAEKAAAEAQLTAQVYENEVYKLYIKYKLNAQDKISSDGLICRVNQESDEK